MHGPLLCPLPADRPQSRTAAPPPLRLRDVRRLTREVSPPGEQPPCSALDSDTQKPFSGKKCCSVFPQLVSRTEAWHAMPHCKRCLTAALSPRAGSRGLRAPREPAEPYGHRLSSEALRNPHQCLHKWEKLSFTFILTA